MTVLVLDIAISLAVLSENTVPRVVARHGVLYDRVERGGAYLQSGILNAMLLDRPGILRPTPAIAPTSACAGPAGHNGRAVFVLVAGDCVRNDGFDFLRHHADIGLIAAVVAEAIEAEAVIELTQQNDIMFEPDVGMKLAAAIAEVAVTKAAIAEAAVTKAAIAEAAVAAIAEAAMTAITEAAMTPITEAAMTAITEAAMAAITEAAMAAVTLALAAVTLAWPP